MLHRFADRQEEHVLAQPREDAEALQLVFDGIFHLGHAQFDALGVKLLVELGDHVGGGDVHARDRLGRDHEPADGRRRARDGGEDPVAEELSVGEKERGVPAKQDEARNLPRLLDTA